MRSFLRRFVSEDTRLSLTDRATHTYVIGQPGTGKSRALESWVMQDIAAGHGVAVIDPHGDLFERLLFRLSQNSDYAKRVVIIDPCDPQWVVSFNPLEALSSIPPERLALFLTDIVIKIWSVTPSAAPRMIWLLTNTFLALADLDLTLLELPQFLLDKDFREKLLPRVKHKNVVMYFEHEFPKPRWQVHEWATPVLNKIGGLVFDSDMRLLLAKGSSLNFREAIDRNLILLVHLPKGILGEEASALLAAFIVAQFQKAALSRADSHERQTYFLYLDEFQSYTTDNIVDILSESRKYGLSLTLAHQYLDQLPAKLQSAVLNTAGTMISFRVGYQDAYQLAKEIFTSREFLAPAKWNFNLKNINSLPFINVETQKEPLGWEGLSENLTNLPNRNFWMRRRGLHTPLKLHTLDTPDILLTSLIKDQIGQLRVVSGRTFGRSKREVQRLVARTPIFSSSETTSKTQSSIPKLEEFSPWGQ